MSRKHPIPPPPFTPKPLPPPAPPEKKYPPWDLPPASSGTPMPKCKPPKNESPYHKICTIYRRNMEIADLKRILAEIADIAHEGGRCNLSESDALNEVRRLTIPHWKNAASWESFKGKMVAVAHWEDFDLMDAVQLGIFSHYDNDHFYIVGSNRGWRYMKMVSNRTHRAKSGDGSIAGVKTVIDPGMPPNEVVVSNGKQVVKITAAPSGEGEK